MSIIGFILQLLSRLWGRVFLGMLFAFVALSSNVGLMMTSAWVLSAAALHPSIAYIQVGIVGVRFFGISRAVTRYLERILSHDVTFRILGMLRVKFFERILKERAPPFFVGDLLQRVMGDINRLENIFIRSIAPILLSLLVSLLGALLFSSWHFHFAVWFFVVTLVIGFVLPYGANKMCRGVHSRYHALQRSMATLVQDAFQGAGDIRVMGRERAQASQFEANLQAQVFPI